MDIGCGDGSLIIQFAHAFANSTFYGINPDSFGIETAKSAISHLGLQDSVMVENIGGEQITYRDEFDMACMVVTLHEIPPDIREKVVDKAFQCLKEGGNLLILDFPYPCQMEDFRNPMYEYGVIDQFYEMCIGTVHLDKQKQEEMLAKYGFKDIQRTPIGKGMLEFVMATK